MSCMTPTRSAPVGRFLIVVSILSVLAATASAQILGDANGDGTLDLNDVTFIQAAIDGGYADTLPFALSDVAYPCDGRIDAADLALVDRAVRAGERGAPLGSVCHGGSVGEVPPPPGTGDPVTLDELFLQVASQVPQFGGVYFDRLGQPVLVLTDTDPSIHIAAVEAVIEVFGYDRFGTDEFDAVEGRFGFEDIHDARVLARGALSHPDVVSVDTDEVRNRARIGISDANSREAVENLLEQLGVWLDMAIVEEVEPTVDYQAGFNLWERPLVGGIGGDVCTAGPVVNRSGVRGMLTNSHCTAMQGVVDSFNFHQPAANFMGINTLVGIEQFESALSTSANNPDCPSGEICRFADAVFVNVGFTTTTRRGLIKNSYSPASYPSRFVQDVETAPLCGDQVRKSGGVTGRTEGEIIHTCVDVQSSTSGIMNLCSFQASATSTNGDSGSPVYRTDYFGPNGAQLYGMLWGGGPSHITFSPISGITAHLGNMNFLAVDEPPIVTILNPADKNTIGTGSSFPITLTAAVSDFEDGLDCNGCQVSWKSTLDGFLGTVPVVGGAASLNVELFGPGTRTLTVTAQDSTGHKSEDQITVYTGNSAPTVWVVEPANGAQIPVGAGVTFVAGSSDPESLGGPLGCGSLAWTSNVPGDPVAIDCAPTLTFTTLGPRQITLLGIDSHGDTHTATITVDVVPVGSIADPYVTMVEPTFNPLLAREKFHSLTGYATDPDGKSPILYEWVLKGQGLIGAVNGELTIGVATGNNGVPNTLTWKPSNYVIEACGGIVLDLELRATDPDNEQASLTRQITVSGPLC